MIGLGKEDARVALEGGWPRETLLALNQVMRLRNLEITAKTPWSFFVGNAYMIYGSYTPSEVERAFDMPGDGRIEAYADGSGTTMDKPAGIGVVVYRPGYRPELIAENIGPGTNNRAELLAIWRAMRACPDVMAPLLICSDSEYAIGSCTKDWAPMANAQLIRAMRYDLMLRSTVRQVEFKHVPGHRNVEGNEIADKLANIGRKIVTIPTVYQDV